MKAIYDGPIDYVNFQPSAVILDDIPTLTNDGISIEPIGVNPGIIVVGIDGNLSPLREGMLYKPSGCHDTSCAQTYTGQEPFLMDHAVVRYKIRPAILWSDGENLTAGDSQYAYEVTASLFPEVKAEIIARTLNYFGHDPSTIVWETIPGFLPLDYVNSFFPPLPEHAWGALSVEELFLSDMANRTPLGWGAYTVNEWIPGSHISLIKNFNYFRSDDGLPKFDHLIFRFTSSTDEVLALLSDGDYDYISKSALLDLDKVELFSLKENGEMHVETKVGTAWEHIDFGINSIDETITLFTSQKETRQALAMCIDRERFVTELFPGESEVCHSYVHPSHPLFNPNIRQYNFHPQTAAALLDSSGWVDGDGDASTPRKALGVPGVADDTPLIFTLLTTNEDEKIKAGELIKESISNCGVQVDISNLPVEEFYAPGPDGPVFGRKFSRTQLNWISSLQPACSLYKSSEIPGLYPESKMGWGGANVSGYSNPEYDRICSNANSSIPEMTAYPDSHFAVQEIFSEELPALPLYLRPEWVITRPEMCAVQVDPSALSSMRDIEDFECGEGCRTVW